MAESGQIEAGNIDLSKRPRVRNPDGSTSTLRSMSFNENGMEVLVPTLSPEGQQWTPEQAFEAYRKSGQHLGKFKTAAEATAYSKRLSEQMGTPQIDTERRLSEFEDMERWAKQPPATPPAGAPVLPDGDDDSAGDYLRDLEERRLEQDVGSMEEWVKSTTQAPEVPTKADPFEHKRPAPEDESASGRVMRNVAEIPGQAAMGSLEAVQNAANAFRPLTGELTDWLNENAVDLRFQSPLPPRTKTGRITRSYATFLTGFIPALKYLRMAGAGAFTGPAAAGIISDFLTREPHEARLADLWNEMGWPKNILTDFLESDPTDTDSEARAKNALEGLAIGLGTEGAKEAIRGVFIAMRTLRAARAVKRVQDATLAKETAQETMKREYGEITDEMAKELWGDPIRPTLEVVEGSADDLTRAQPGQIMGEPVGAINLADQRMIEAVQATRGVEAKGVQEAIEKGVQQGKKVEPKLGAGEVAEGGRRQPRLAAADVKLAPSKAEPTMSQTRDAFLTKEQAQGLTGKVPKQVFVNWARINEPADVKAVMQEMTERFRGHIKEAQRGVISHEMTQQMADELGVDPTWLLNRNRGDPLNAERMVAAKMLWAAATENLEAAIRRAAHPNAGAIDQAVFDRAMAIQFAIQRETLGAQTEAARSVSAMRIPVGGSIEKAKALRELVEQSGGVKFHADLAKRMAIILDRAPDAITKRRTIGKMAEIAQRATVWDAFSEVWVSGLLSSPATQLINTGSSVMAAYQQVYERGVASLIASARGAEGSVAPGEALMMLHAQVSATKDAFRMGWHALRTGETGAALGKVDLPRKSAMAAETFRLQNDSTLGRTINVIGSGFRVFPRLMAASDEAVKTIVARGELEAQALRQATREGHKSMALGMRVEQLKQNPTEAMRLAAKDAALYATFTSDPQSGGAEIGRTLLRARARIPALVVIMPFIKTPVAIGRYTFERSPFAPLVGQWRADIAAGGARADIAMARMATGTSMMAVALDLADRGLISGKGPQDPGQREAMTRQGWKPYSVKVGGKWYPYNRIDPLGAQLGFAANIAEMVRTKELNEDDLDQAHEIMGAGLTAVSEVAINKTYMQGFSDFIHLVTEGERYGESYVEKLVGSMVPFTSLSGAVERVVDPTRREVHGGWDAIQAKIAGMSDSLPPVLNLWGEEVKDTVEFGGPAAGPGKKVATKAYDFFSPIMSSEIKPTPIDTEIMRLAPIVGADNTAGAAPRRIGKTPSFMGVKVNMKDWPEVYVAYVKLAGNEFKHPAFGLGAKDFLNKLVSGDHPISAVYKMRSDPMKAQMINNIIEQYRSAAQQKIMMDPKFKDFATYVTAVRQRKMEQKMPMLEQMETQ